MNECWRNRYIYLSEGEKKRKRVDETFKQIKRKGKAEEIWKNYCKNLKLKQIL